MGISTGTPEFRFRAIGNIESVAPVKREEEEARRQKRERSLTQKYNFKNKILALARKVCRHKWRVRGFYFYFYFCL